MKKNYIVSEIFNNQSLLFYLKDIGYSAGMLRGLRQGEYYRVNGKSHRLIDAVYTGDKIDIDFPEKEPKLKPNGNLKIEIAYEDEDILVFDKPDDILVHPAAKGFDDALGNYFAFLHPDITFRPLGRLDRHTTGLCLIAKNRLTAGQLNHKIKKEYIALAEGIFAEDEGTVNAAIIRVPGSVISRTVDPKGQSAITKFKVLERYENHTLLKLKLETGRTHQIRVHMAYLGHPLAGDDLYGGHKNIMLRQALHCQKIIIFNKNEEITVTAKTPPDLLFCLNSLKITP
ncbi:MAG: RluA family pseudouridine synthase [Clostridiales bacterium]